MTTNPRQLSEELRNSDDPNLRNRRGIIALSALASASMGLIALYQTGVIRRLPDLPSKWFDADRVDASDEAYSRFATPDAILGLGSYAMTMGLAAIGGRDRSPWLSRAMLAKVLFDVANAARLTRDQWTKYRAFCVWCLLAAGATFAMLPLASKAMLTATSSPRSTPPESSE
jgi:uncharacterized membrane protein